MAIIVIYHYFLNFSLVCRTSLALVLYWWFYFAQVYDTDSTVAVVLKNRSVSEKCLAAAWLSHFYWLIRFILRTLKFPPQVSKIHVAAGCELVRIPGRSASLVNQSLGFSSPQWQLMASAFDVSKDAAYQPRNEQGGPSSSVYPKCVTGH